MSEQISHIAFFDDMVRLIPSKSGISPDFIEAVLTFPDHGAIATSARGNHLYAVPMIEKAKGQIDDPSKKDENLKLLAGAQGWLCHRAIDLVMKPISIKKNPGEIYSPRFSGDEGEIYQDAVSYREILDSGFGNPVFKTIKITPYVLSDDFEGHPLKAAFYNEDLEELIGASVTADMIGVYYELEVPSTAQEAKSIFASGYQEYSEQFETYVNAFSYPDSERQKVYLENKNYYSQDDPLIRLAKKSKKEKIGNDELNKALALDAEFSKYEEALRKAIFFLSEASRFYKDELEKDQLYDAVENFHPPHRI
jgi:hypothetical protein